MRTQRLGPAARPGPASPATREISLRIDGRELRALPGVPLLEVARAARIEIPTLCDHPALEPAGACRLCMVEVTHPDWKGWSGLMTACLYPAAAGLEVQTGSARVQRARRQVLSLLAARCPTAPAIQTLAARYGASTEGLRVDADADRCILCGLCTRVCESHATSAITTFSRGSTRQVGAFLQQPPAECVGCAACASVCPTENIEVSAGGSRLEIWGRQFEAAICQVAPERCIGCGACEEACPFAVPRVGLRLAVEAPGEVDRLAQIAAEHCRGCGACVGACPTGAIDQAIPFHRAGLAGEQAGTLAVVACTRCNLASVGLPEGVRLLEVPCTARVTVPLLLRLASRHPGVLVLGRHPQTCRLGEAEASAADRSARAAGLLATVGLGGRLRFAQAEPGPAGPGRTVQAFAAEVQALGPWPLWAGAAPPLESEGIAGGLQILRELAARPGAEPDQSWLRAVGLPAARPEGPALAAGELHWIQLLAGSLLRPLSIPELLRDALALLAQLGVEGAGIALAGHAGPLYRIGGEPGPEATAVSLSGLLASHGARLPRPPQSTCIACDGSAPSRALLTALGYTPLDVGPDPLPGSFELRPEDRRRAEARLALAERGGAAGLLCDSPLALLRWTLCARQGSWRGSRVPPLLAAQLATASLRGGLPGEPTPRAVAEVAP